MLTLSKVYFVVNFTISNVSEDYLKCHPRRRKQFLRKYGFAETLVCYFASLDFWQLLLKLINVGILIKCEGIGNEKLMDIGGEWEGGGGLKLWTSTFLFYFFKENWICAMSRHHAEPNINYIMDKKSRCWLWRQQKGRSGRMGYSESERSRSKEDRAWMILKKWTFFMPVICVSYLKPLFIFLT